MTGIPDDPADEATLWAGRLRAWPAADSATEPDADLEDTRPTDRAAGEAAARPRGGGVRHPVPTDPLDEGTVMRRSPPAPAERVERRRPTVPPAGAVRPATRREASGRIAAPADTARNASVPVPAAREIYRPRPADPVIVDRRPPHRPPGAGGPVPDATLAQRRARTIRRRFVVTAASAATVALAALAGAILLLPR